MANTYKYLDESGLTHVHSLIDTNKKLTGGVEYIVGTQSASTNAWTGTSTDVACKNSALYTGKVIIYHLPYAGTSSTATLNLTLPDGTTTGAKTIHRLNNTTVTTNFVAGCDILMVFTGTYWKVNAYVDSNTNTIGYQLRTNSAIYTNKTGYAMNRYMLFFEVDGGLSGASTTIATGTTKTPVNFKYIPGGVIKYNTTNASVANNANFTATGLWDQYVLDLRYTFNTGSTLTAGKPVYMRCVVNSDGTLSPNYSGSPSHPITQALPTTADGYVYVYLGQAYSTTNMELNLEHPIYEYKNGKIREWQYDTDISGKQDTLISGTNIKTINGNSLLGSGNISISSGGTATDVQINGTSIVSNNIANLLTQSAYSSSNKLATMSDIHANATQIDDNTTNILDLPTGLYVTTANANEQKISYYDEDLGEQTTFDFYINTTFELIKSAGDLDNITINILAGTEPQILRLVDFSSFGMGYVGSLYKIPSTNDIPTKTSDLTNDSGFINGITSSMVTTALGYTPYNSTNPNGYTSNTGTITGITMNGSSKGTSGVVNLGTVLTAHQSIKTINNTSMTGSGNVSVQPTLVSGTNIKTIKSTSLLGSGNIEINDFTEIDTTNGVNIWEMGAGSYKLSGNGNIQINFGANPLSAIAPAYLFVADDSLHDSVVITDNRIFSGKSTSSTDGDYVLIGGDDTGWQTLTLASGFSSATGTPSSTPQIRRIGNHVYLRGLVKFTRNSSTQTFATLSSEYTPGAWVYKLACLQGTRYARIGVNPDSGACFIDWIYPANGTTAVTTGSITWLDITMDWFTD